MPRKIINEDPVFKVGDKVIRRYIGAGETKGFAITLEEGKIYIVTDIMNDCVLSEEKCIAIRFQSPDWWWNASNFIMQKALPRNYKHD